MKRAVCSGSFDPVTSGHIDIFERASRMFDEILVCVFCNIRKKSFFSVEQRMDFLREATSHIPNLKVDSFSGLLVDYMREHDARILVRGVRSVKDLEYEQDNARAIAHLAPEIETVFLMTAPSYSFVSSSCVRELAAFRGSVHGIVPLCVEEAILERWKQEE